MWSKGKFNDIRKLIADNSDEPIKHPLVKEIFTGKKGSGYFKPSN